MTTKTQGVLISMLLRFVRGTLSTFVSVLAILVPIGFPVDQYTIGLSGLIAVLSGVVLALDKGARDLFPKP